MTVKPCTLHVIHVIFVFHLLGVLGSIAQDHLNIKLICPKHEIIAGENLGFQVVISNSSQRICIAPPQFMLYLNLIVQTGGTNVPYQIKRSHQSFGDIEIAANSTMTIDEDLCTWFPLGLFAGEFTLSMAYIPNKEDRSFTLRSNTIQITVAPRSPEQEMEYEAFVGILSSSRKEAIQKATQFLVTYSNSIFEPRVRLELAGRYLTAGDYDSANKVLEGILFFSSATIREKGSKHYLSARVMKAQGRFAEAIVEAEKCPSLWIPNIRAEFIAPEVILEAQVTLKPESLNVSPGILTAFVRLPEGFSVKNITSAICDGALSERMMLNDDQTEMIIKFRRQDIENALAQIRESIDTNFVVRGIWQGTVGTCLFQGAASIKKIVGANLSRSGREEKKK